MGASLPSAAPYQEPGTIAICNALEMPLVSLRQDYSVGAILAYFGAKDTVPDTKILARYLSYLTTARWS